MPLLLLLACGAPEKDSAEPDAPAEADAPAFSVEVAPPAFDYGDVALGTTASQVTTVTNTGTTLVSLSAVSATSDTITLDADLLPIPPGGAQQVVVTWSPAQAGALADTVRYVVEDTEGGVLEVPVTVSGLATGATLGLSARSADFGAVTVGCEAETTITVSNSGSVDLTVTEVGFDVQADLDVTGADGALSLPWTLAPGEARDLVVTFAPLDDQVLAANLRIGSDDALAPITNVPLAGTGVVDGEGSVSYEVVGVENITALFAVNEIVLYDDKLEDALPTLFDTLLESGVPFRLAFLIMTTGIVDGSVPYVDETWTSEDATDAVLTMIQNGRSDNDYLLQTLSDGIVQNRSWLLDDDVLWADSQLNLVGINSDMEQSAGDYKYFLLDYWTYKDDPEDIVVHAIGGDPGGCSGAGGSAEPFLPFYEAATATGGTFLSFCEGDWTGHMEALGAAFTGDAQIFELEGAPAVWSIEVYVDRAPTSDGWVYDEDRNAIVFDDDAYPPEGSEVRVDYFLEVDCAA